MEAYGQSQVSNNLEELKKYLENSNYDRNRISAIQYVYNINFVVHGTDVYGNEKRELYTAFEKLMSLIWAIPKIVAPGRVLVIWFHRL